MRRIVSILLMVFMLVGCGAAPEKTVQTDVFAWVQDADFAQETRTVVRELIISGADKTSFDRLCEAAEEAEGLRSYFLQGYTGKNADFAINYLAACDSFLETLVKVRVGDGTFSGAREQIEKLGAKLTREVSPEFERLLPVLAQVSEENPLLALAACAMHTVRERERGDKTVSLTLGGGKPEEELLLLAPVLQNDSLSVTSFVAGERFYETEEGKAGVFGILLAQDDPDGFSGELEAGIAALRKKGAQLAVAFLAGEGDGVQAGRLAVDLGADVALVSAAQGARGVEWYRGRVIVHMPDLQSFLFRLNFWPDGTDAHPLDSLLIPLETANGELLPVFGTAAEKFREELLADGAQLEFGAREFALLG